jgi:uncharacterized SAM-binding protein YcdF (DUF218 family)
MDVSTSKKDESSRPSHATRSKGGILLLLLCVFVLVGFGFRHSFLEASASFLDVGEEPARADLIYVLGGNPEYRPAAAAKLYLQGYAPRIVLSRIRDNDANLMGVIKNETDASHEILLRLGVPESAIVVTNFGDGVASTTDDARSLAEYVRQTPVERVIVLTSRYHTRRARWNFRQQLDDGGPEILVIGVTDPRFTAQNWWRSEAGMLAYTEEYMKFVHDWMYR